MKLPEFSKIRNNIIKSIFLSIAILIMATPVLANSDAWSFWAPYNGRKLTGTVAHSMTKGTLTISGKIWVNSIMGGTPSGNQPWYFEVINQATGAKLCTAGPVYPPAMVGPQYTTSFSKNCGATAAAKYTLTIWRADSDNRETSGSGTLVTK